MNFPGEQSSLKHFTGVSFPRSGHHLLVRVLNKYFGPKFVYCEYYNPADCCRAVPCEFADRVTFSKNHDYESCVPILTHQRYLIQYRAFVPAVVSDYELHARQLADDSRALFRKFAKNQVRKIPGIHETMVSRGSRRFDFREDFV